MIDFEERNEYGFPVIDKLEAAKEYAAAAKERNQPQCDCTTCRYNSDLERVQQLTTRWGL